MGSGNAREGSGKPAAKVMSIETGFSCNAYCGFCPQLNYRGELIEGLSPDLTTEEIRERIRFGRQSGYRQIGFSGGEPTLRKDLVELVGYARSQGYELIGITTNGMMLAYPGYAAALVQAGLSAINYSVNGDTARLHDAMMRTPGSFEALRRGMDNVQALRSRTRVRLELMSMTLAAPQTIDRFPDIVRLVGQYGVKLHMIQPFLMTKGNTHLAHGYLTSYDAIETAVRAAAEVARAHDGHIKLFNTPVCRFWDIEDRLERQWKKLDVFREHEKHAAGELSVRFTSAERETPAGYFRIDACATCDEPCNGFRAEYYPQEAMVAEVRAAMEAHLDRYGTAELWVGGLELLSGESQRAVLGAARERGVSRLVLLSGGIGRAYHEQFDEGIQGLVDEVCFVVQPRRPDARALTDRPLAHGNLDDIGKGMERLRRRLVRQPDSVSATLSVHELRRDPALPEQLRSLGIRRLRLGEQADPRPGSRSYVEAPGFGELLAGLTAQGFEVELIGGGQPAPRALRDYRPHLLRHRWTTREAEWIVWSIPSWTRELPPEGRLAQIGGGPPAVVAPVDP